MLLISEVSFVRIPFFNDLRFFPRNKQLPHQRAHSLDRVRIYFFVCKILMRLPVHSFNWNAVRSPGLWLVILATGGCSLLGNDAGSWLRPLRHTCQRRPVFLGCQRGDELFLSLRASSSVCMAPQGHCAPGNLPLNQIPGINIRKYKIVPGIQ